MFLASCCMYPKLKWKSLFIKLPEILLKNLTYKSLVLRAPGARYFC